jgi:hypothetical protein
MNNKRIVDMPATEFLSRLTAAYPEGSHSVEVGALADAVGMTDFPLFVVGLCLKRYGAVKAGRSRAGSVWTFTVGATLALDDFLAKKIGHYVMVDGRRVLVVDSFRDADGKLWCQVAEPRAAKRLS